MKRETHPKNILIVKLSAIGDVIHTLPALNALRNHYSDAKITWVVESAASDLISGHQALDRVLISHRKRWIRDLAGPARVRNEAVSQLHRFVQQLRDTYYDLVLDFQALLKSGMLVAMARGKRKIGFDRGMQHMEGSYVFLTERIPPISMEIHALKRNLIMLEHLGIFTQQVDYRIPISEAEIGAVDRLCRLHGIDANMPVVAINPVAKWETKLWYNDRFALLADELIAGHGIQVVFTGGPEDREIIERILQAMTSPAVNLAGCTTLKELAQLYTRCRLVVSTDTGPMHLAAAVETPVVAIFGPTAPWRTGPFGSGHRVVRTPMACSPCFKRKCSHRSCMNAVGVGDVMAAITQTGALG